MSSSVSPSPRCDESRIARFLAGQLAIDEEHALERHLDSCATCRQRLQSTAAEPSWWQDVTNLLRKDALDVEYAEIAISSHAGTPAIEHRDLGDMARLIIDSLAPTDDPRMLGRLGGYEIVGVVGSGGMGVVLKGFDPPLNRYVAIKVLAPHLASNGAARRRFAREAQAAAAVVHENVIAIHGIGTFHGLPYLVMPYVAGPSLQRRLDQVGPLEPAEILRIGHQVAAGLAAAHAQGLVHRDIKPANILLENGVERVLITDFGLARAADDASLTHSGVIAGTPQYMSPEQARGDAVDHRSDLFSLGSLMYAMCTGRPPFRAESALGVLHRISTDSARPIREIVPHVPEWLCEIVEQLHAKDPSRRFQSASDVADLVVRWLAHLQQPHVVPAPARLHADRFERARPWWRQLAWAAAVAASGIVALVLSATVPRLLRNTPMAAESSDGAARAHRAANESKADLGALELLSTDQALYEAYDEVHARATHLDHEWSRFPPSSAGDSVAIGISELEQQLDDLSHRIERSFP